jgi:SAM-dependent methyltransferase
MPVNYDQISQVYDAVRRADVELVEAFRREVPLDEPVRVLDLGCGTGNYADLVQRATGAVVCGVEPSAGMLEKARQKNAALVLKQGNAASIPFEKAQLDFVYMTDVIHHVPDLRAMFAEIRRVLRPEGKICIVTQSHAQIALRPIARFFPGTVQVDQSRYPDIPAIIGAAQACGFALLREETLFADQPVVLGADFLELVRNKGYSMLHVIPKAEYKAGLRTLETQIASGPITATQAGETLVWLGRTARA